MRIDESAGRAGPVPPHLESLGTSGVAPFPPTDASLKDYGPLSDTPTQRELDARASDVEVISEGQSLSPIQASLRRLGRDRRAMICLTLVILIVTLSYIFPYVYLHLGPPDEVSTQFGVATVGPEYYHNPIQQDYARKAGTPGSLPTLLHPMGADVLGRDVFARSMAGVNTSIQVALLVEVMDIGLGVLIGTLAGFFGGWVDTLLARFTDVMFAFPGLLLVIIAAATLGQTATDKLGAQGRLIIVALALGFTIWPQMARFVRGQTLQIKEQQYVEAARTVGGTNRQIVMRHIVPNLFSIVVTAASLNIVGTIIGEAVISLLGLGVQPPGSSLGLMISDGIADLNIAPTEVLFPVAVLTILVVCFSFLGDGIRDAFDPRTKD